MFFDNNDRMNIAVVHEMFHLMEGETAEEDHIRFGTTEDPSHNTLFDKAASEFIVLTRKGSKISLDGNATYGSIESLIGSQGSDNLVASSGYRGAFINAGAGDDNISLQFASSVADGGTGDDSYFISGEMGSLTIFDESGVDTLHFGSGITRQQLVVRETDGWVEIGVNSTGLNNVTPSGLTAWLVISPASDGSRAIEYVRVGGSTYTFGDILASSNHRPFLTSPPEFHSGTSAGQPLGVVSSVDLDSAALQYSVVSVTGWGQGHSWSIWNGQLYSSAPLPSYVTVSNIVIRVSDGRLYSDQTAMVHWSAKGEYVSHSPVYDRGFSGISGAAFQHDDEIAAQSLGWNVAQTGIDNIPLTQIMV